MSIGLNHEELTKIFTASEARILNELQLASRGKTTATTTEQIASVMNLVIGKATEVILANNQRIADQLAAAGIMLEPNK